MNTKTEIIAVGSELLLGQIVNSNAQFISGELAEMGFNTYYHTVTGDNAGRLRAAIEVAQSRSNVIIFTGGLGPTKDDLTKETIASHLNVNLVTDDEAMSSIEDYFKKVNRTMTENNRKQALVLEGAHILKNDTGMAPGMALEADGIVYILMPGPPSEMRPMFSNYARPYLLELLGEQEKIMSRVLRYFGIGESQLEADLEDLIDGQTNPTIAPLAGDGEVTLRLTARHKEATTATQLLNELEQTINARVGDYFYGYESTSLLQEVTDQLIERKITISSAESLTGGLFSEQLTTVKGTSSVLKGGIVCYSNSVKQNLLRVKPETLENHGAVSRQCAREMAENIRRLAESDIGISFTGVAGPEPMDNQPVGTVYIGIASEAQTEVHELKLAGSRDGIRKRTVKYGCRLLMKHLEKHTAI
ncbi:competence/damage-inducible protein A [Metabacillus sp. KIGAM252]|uniref:Putative competence-damage inducible protein n=1 Tax=Metabacillus flavus TaxID=2823519 RepID=A0ABS5LE79_9BACI|nr:competence/damage-inducible protein A [Metabacillus flavus]MBS2969058.1 competence/damage-inducible protein A [Metabacillus flavus]